MLPATAPVFAQALGPRDTLDFYLQVTSGGDADDILMDGETVSSFGVALSAEAIAAGLVLLTDSQHAPILSTDNVVEIWVQVASAYQANSIYDLGVVLGVELTFVTSNSPPRTKVRTVGIKVVNQ